MLYTKQTLIGLEFTKRNDKMKASVTVIVPVYNAEGYIKACAISLFKQTLDSIEYIFVNDASTDRSIDVLKEVISSFPQRGESVKIITHDKNKGLPEARRTGLLAATGDYIIHCDSDDWIEPEMYAEMYEKALAENADIVACNMIIDRGVSKTESKYSYSIETPSQLQEMYLINGVYSTLCNKLVKASLYTDYKIEPLQNVFMWEDFAVSFRLRLHSRKTVIVPKAFYHYMIYNGESVKHFSEEKIKNQIYCAEYFEKYIKEVFSEQASAYNLAILYLKFMAKLGYFTNKETQDFRKWKNTFVESNLKLMDYLTIPMARRIVFYIGLHVSPRLAFYIYNLSRNILR